MKNGNPILLKRIILAFIFILGYTCLRAQIDNIVLTANLKSGVLSDTNAVEVTRINFGDSITASNIARIYGIKNTSNFNHFTDYNGNLLGFTLENYLFDKAGNILDSVGAQTQILPGLVEIPKTGLLQSATCLIGNNQYAWFYWSTTTLKDYECVSAYPTNKRLFASVIDFATGKIIRKDVEIISPEIGNHSGYLEIAPHADGNKWWIVTVHKDTIQSRLVDASLSVLDLAESPLPSPFKYEFKYDVPMIYRYFNNYVFDFPLHSNETVNSCKFSPKHNKLAFYFVMPYKSNCDNPIEVHNNTVGRIILCSFNKESGKTNTYTEVDTFKAYAGSYHGLEYINSTFGFSLDENNLYYNKIQSGHTFGGSDGGPYTLIYIYEFNIKFRKVISKNGYGVGPFFDFAQLVGDKLYFSRNGYRQSSIQNDTSERYSYIQKKESDQPLVYNQANTLPEINFNFLTKNARRLFSRSGIPIKALEFRYEQTCRKHTLRFIPFGDTSQFVFYRLYYPNGDSIQFGNNATYPEFTFDTTGNYVVKIKGFSPYIGWHRWQDTVAVLPVPKANFIAEDTIDCQWVAFKLQDMSFHGRKDAPSGFPKLTWNFGDGKTLTHEVTNQPVYHTYTQNGQFVISLVVDDGFCKDTFTRVQHVEILAAPQPGLEILPEKLCAPIHAQIRNRYQDVSDSIKWIISPQMLEQTTYGVNSISHFFEKPGEFSVVHLLYGNTGCITSDTMNIVVFQGFETSDSPYLHLVTYTTNTLAHAHWNGLHQAQEYRFYNTEYHTYQNVTDTFIDFTLQLNLQKTLHYYVKAVDVCNNESVASNLGTLIYLKTSIEKDEGKIVWSPYLNWSTGVERYELLSYYDNEAPTTLYSTVSDTDYFEIDFFKEYTWQKCYKVQAINFDGMVSQSNEQCIPQIIRAFIPNAFSPNGDGLNDVFSISHSGFVTANMKIFNSWGQMIYSGDPVKEPWYADGCQQGIYMYLIEMYNADNKRWQFSGSIHLLK